MTNSVKSNDSTADARVIDEWNSQTIVDSRNVLLIQQSSEPSQTGDSPRLTTIKQPPQQYPNHILHPEVIPSFKEVPLELNKRRRHVRGTTDLDDPFDSEMPLEIASSLQEEVDRAVQSRAAQDRMTSTQGLEPNFEGVPENGVIPAEYSLKPNSQVEHVQQQHQQQYVQKAASSVSVETFQRITIAGDFHDMSHIEDLDEAVGPLLRALVIREKYMIFSLQSFPSIVAKFLTKTLENEDKSRRVSSTVIKLNADHPYHPPVIKREEAFNIPILDPIDVCVKPEYGIYRPYILDDKNQWVCADFPIVDRDQFIEDYTLLSAIIMDGPLKSFCYRRLQYLKAKYELHGLLNEVKEWAAIKSTPHRDFYNVRKVDTHVHAASSMNQKHLLRFMKKKMKKSPDMPVYKTKDGRIMTLKQVFDELHITAYDLSVDMLGVHADRNTFQRFDRFNTKYNPLGQSTLREIFIKTDNYINGVFFADLLKEVISDLEDSKYQHAELRLSIYGKSMDEWDKLAKWVIKNTMYSANVGWMVQIPRLYDVYHANGITKNFQEFLSNLFEPLFAATINPGAHPDLFKFMHHASSLYLSGLDSVDDETKPERPILTSDMPYPEAWSQKDNPPYVYYIFYMYANILTLNQLRRSRGLNTIQFRPHCGEAGAVTHLVAAYMCAENISHGLLLRKSPVLQYLFYLCQIGIAMSPLSNNSLFINYNRNPMLEYFERGLCVSLSTDDPMQFHFTKEPLMEEYSIAAQVWKLSSVDMCELARNSVLMSGFSDEVKQYWLGLNYMLPGIAGNDIRRTNVPSIRIAYRYEALCEELRLLGIAYKDRRDRKIKGDMESLPDHHLTTPKQAHNSSHAGKQSTVHDHQRAPLSFSPYTHKNITEDIHMSDMEVETVLDDISGLDNRHQEKQLF
ncbi:unnamed protein product [Didymodactylos carnosus]|uniref:AMP deaminase 2 n=1 Tax=Didymodactylos carnosus TaxID=1234261 RepID=A0A814KY07_9BILA|nr:unnamed protein product [Didymodactylos carnosus]CAF1056853.1 unnamed protein product [Didymodactylos carnosus]CAF3644981.1 unnamed protein product [Didymodactylos carnosus]CAF3825759.1 unnamed protein product [Didymodactylos carnosus]